MVDEVRGTEKYPASILAELKNAAAQIMAAATQLPEIHSAPLDAAAKNVFELVSELEKSEEPPKVLSESK